jgi:hypothetical protein
MAQTEDLSFIDDAVRSAYPGQEVESSMTWTLPISGDIVHRYKLFDPESEYSFDVCIGEDLAHVDCGQKEEAEAAARFEAVGVMEDELVRWYDQNQDDSAIVKASFYATSELKPPEFDREVSRSHEQHRADMAKHIEAMASYLEEIKAPAIAALEKDGATEIYSARLSPVIVAHVPRSLITKNAKNTTLFSSIGHAKGGVKLHSKIATEAAEINQYYQQSMQGDGYKIAVVEPGEVYFNNSFILSPTVRRVNKAHNSWTDCDSGPDTDHCELFLERHATFVAGMASSYYLFWSVGAPLVDVVSANWSGNDFEPESYVTAAMDWAVSTQNSDILNHSYGCEHPNGQFYCGSTLPYHREYLVNNYYITSVHSAGNVGEEGWESGCQDFNSICVGAHSDANTSRYTNPQRPPVCTPSTTG